MWTFILWKTIDICFRILEKIFWKYFSRKIKIMPTNLVFNKSERIQKKSFCVYNRTDMALYDIHLLILDKVRNVSDLDISYKNRQNKNNLSLWDIELNKDIFEVIWSWKDKDKSILVISRISPKHHIDILMESKNNHNIKIKMLQYSKESKWTVSKNWGIGFPFTIPKNTTKDNSFSIGWIKICLKKN